MSEEIYVHETSMVDGRAVIGSGTKVWQFCNIMGGSRIGRGCNIGQNVFIEGGVTIGNHVKIKNNVALYNGVVCEDGVFLGPGCVFTNVLNPRSYIERKNEFQKTYIEEGATIGANATIICGNTIGKYAMVGAGAVVTKDVPAYHLVVGNPSVMTGFVCECGEKLEEGQGEAICRKCQKKYRIDDHRIYLLNY